MMNVYNKKILFFLSICLVVFTNFFLFAEEKTFILNADTAWNSLEVKNGVTDGKGRFGKQCITLDTNSRPVSNFTDLLIDFEDGEPLDVSGKYELVHNSLYPTKNAVMGRKAALSRGKGPGIVMRGKSGTIFGSDGNTGSFTIEFWLYPSIAENGEVILEWRSSRISDTNMKYQTITAAFMNNRIEWDFSNIFDGYKDEEVILRSYSAVIPDKWAHHIFSYNEETGLIEYLIDGKVEGLKYITSTDAENGTIYHPILGNPESISICPQFAGCIDDFRIIRSFVSDDGVVGSENVTAGRYDSFKIDGGYFITKKMYTMNGVVYNSIQTLSEKPSQTDIRFYIRSSDNQFGWTESFPEWISVKDGKKIEGASGRFFQIKGELFPDGGGRVSPSVTEVKINYTEPPLPLAPFDVKATSGNGEVTLSWAYSVDDTAQGYYVYYGLRPGEYLCSEAVEGASPVKVGNVTSIKLTGLKNGTIYYFAVATYSKLDERIIGNFSKEVYARPGR